MTTDNLVRRLLPWRRTRRPQDVVFWALPPVVLWQRVGRF